jgi:hypothetical protein
VIRLVQITPSIGAMLMKTMTAREAKTHFGEFLDAMQREPSS